MTECLQNIQASQHLLEREKRERDEQLSLCLCSILHFNDVCFEKRSGF